MSIAITWGEKYRPTRLGDVIGQAAVIQQIRGFIKRNEIPHTILLHGQSGVGKSTLAKLIAQTINQLAPGSVNPDLSEFNMGEQGGIDIVREIIKYSRFAPRNKFRCIVLDECQQISRAAMSALLKPLEEGGPNTVWILATDQPDKLLATIRGRAVKLPLRLPEPEELLPLLRRVCQAECLQFSTKEIADRITIKVSEAAGGQPRDALNLLQAVANCMAAGDNPDNALVHALQTNVSLEKVATKLLVAIYMNKVKIVVKTISDANGEFASLVKQLLDLNSYLICTLTDSPTWHSHARRGFRQVLTTVPDLGLAIRAHNQLVDLHKELATYQVPEYHLLTARLGKLVYQLSSN